MPSFGTFTQPVAAGTNGHRATGAQEAFRVVRSNLLVAIRDLDNPVVVVTSATSGEGKTSTCVGLAQSLSAAGSHVVLVDFALDNPGAHRMLGAGNEFGATDVLLERRDIECCLRYVEFEAADSARSAGMFFLAAGPRVPGSSELLSSPRAGQLLARLAKGADIVLVDSPAVLTSADALAIGRIATGAVLVVEARRTTIPAVNRAKDALIQNQTRLLGVVLNRFEPSLSGSVYGDDRAGYGRGH